jgi:streptogramin lyase
MNIHNLLISALLFLCVFLPACAPATALAPAVTSLPPTNVPPMETPAIAVTIDLNKVSEITHEAETINVDFLNTRVPLPAFDSIWFLSDTQGKVIRWDPETRQVLATIEVGDPGNAPYGDPVSAIATNDAVWITSVAAHEIVKVDPQTNQIVDRFTLPKVGAEQDFFTINMVLVGNTVWLWDYDKKLVQGIDFNTQQAVGNFSHINAISSLNDSLWISTMDGVAQINPATNDVIQRLPAGSPLPAVSAEGSMWGFNNAVYRMDSETYQVTAKIDLGIPVRDMKLVNGSLWVTVSTGAPPACHSGSYLIQIDPKTSTVIGKTALDCPIDITAYKDSLWVDGGTDDQLLLTHIQPNK